MSQTLCQSTGRTISLAKARVTSQSLTLGKPLPTELQMPRTQSESTHSMIQNTVWNRWYSIQTLEDLRHYFQQAPDPPRLSARASLVGHSQIQCDGEFMISNLLHTLSGSQPELGEGACLKLIAHVGLLHWICLHLQYFSISPDSL